MQTTTIAFWYLVPSLWAKENNPPNMLVKKTTDPCATEVLLRVSERVAQSVTTRSFATTSRALLSPPFIISIVEVASSVFLV